MTDKLTASQRFTSLLQANNLRIQLSPFKTRQITDGAFIVEKPELEIHFVDPSLEETNETQVRTHAKPTKPTK